VNGSARVAPLGYAGGWSLSDASSSQEPTANPLIAEHYQRAALLEHASIAAFARFTLELLALGAPAELVQASTQAMADETLHARLCFGLASRYSGHALGPGPLAMHDALGSVELGRIVEQVVLEGCIGESVAAEEAARSLELATDPEVRAALARIAEDERRHAELAFRFIEWALRREPELSERVRSLVESELSLNRTRSMNDGALDVEARHALDHGVFPECWRSALRASVLREFVAPCVEALCARHQSAVRSSGVRAYAS
jgi:hypothetical protein